MSNQMKVSEERDEKIVIDLVKLKFDEEDVMQNRVQMRIQNEFFSSNGNVDILLQMNQLNSPAICKLLAFLSDDKKINRINYLNISCNKLDAEAAFELAKFLELPNCKLSHLDISDCGFDDECMKYIFKALNKNSELSVLMAQDNNLTHTSIRYLSASLMDNPLSKCNQIFINNAKTNKIPFTVESVGILNYLIRKKPGLIIQIHNDDLDISDDIENAELFNAYGRERLRRVAKMKEHKREIYKQEIKRNETLDYFKDIILLCQIYNRITDSDFIYTELVIKMFRYRAYGIKLPEKFQSVIKYLQQAENMDIIKIIDNKIMLTRASLEWKINECIQEGVAKHWYNLMTQLIYALDSPKTVFKVQKELSKYYSIDVINSFIDQCVRAGILLSDEDNIMINSLADSIPIDLTACPKNHSGIFCMNKSVKQINQIKVKEESELTVEHIVNDKPKKKSRNNQSKELVKVPNHKKSRPRSLSSSIIKSMSFN